MTKKTLLQISIVAALLLTMPLVALAGGSYASTGCLAANIVQPDCDPIPCNHKKNMAKNVPNGPSQKYTQGSGKCGEYKAPVSCGGGTGKCGPLEAKRVAANSRSVAVRVACVGYACYPGPSKQQEPFYSI